MNILILGAGGFIGSWLARAILEKTNWTVHGMDLDSHRLNDLLENPRFNFKKASILDSDDWIDQHIRLCDVILPLAAIANPAIYVKDPIRVFELDFEANLKIIRKCIQHQKRLVFPSTSEVYGMCPDKEFSEETSNFVLGPIQKERWIYSCSKQMLDRVIYACGNHQNLQYTIFRPFNWMGPLMDDFYAIEEGKSRAITQFISNAIFGRPIKIVGGNQRRTFIYVDDAIDALMRIIENKDNKANGHIINIGNPQNDASILEFAQMILEIVNTYPDTLHRGKSSKIEITSADAYFGGGYEDVEARVPSIQNAKKYLDWQPTTSLKLALEKTIDYYMALRPLEKTSVNNF